MNIEPTVIAGYDKLHTPARKLCDQHLRAVRAELPHTDLDVLRTRSQRTVFELVTCHNEQPSLLLYMMVIPIITARLATVTEDRQFDLPHNQLIDHLVQIAHDEHQDHTETEQILAITAELMSQIKGQRDTIGLLNALASTAQIRLAHTDFQLPEQAI